VAQTGCSDLGDTDHLGGPMPRNARIAITVTAFLATAAIATAALAQTTPTTQTTTTTTTPTTTTAPQPTPTGATVAIDNCHVKRSRNNGGFTWFYCGVVTDVPGSAPVSVSYRTNLTTFTPSTGGSWSRRSGTLRFTSGQSLLNLKFAVRNQTVAQVRQNLRVTLSNARGATITDATARAAAS
jgi:hypothetical protein